MRGGLECGPDLRESAPTRPQHIKLWKLRGKLEMYECELKFIEVQFNIQSKPAFFVCHRWLHNRPTEVKIKH